VQFGCTFDGIRAARAALDRPLADPKAGHATFRELMQSTRGSWEHLSVNMPALNASNLPSCITKIFEKKLFAISSPDVR
jgi:hypothetical protein